MKKQSLFGVFAFALMICLGGASAHAQETPKISIFGGYSYGLNNLGQNTCFFTCGQGASGLHGYAASATYNVTKNIGFEATFSGHNGSPILASEAPTSTSNGFEERSAQDVYTYTFGPKVTLPIGNFAAYTHFLVGAMHAHQAFTDACVPATGSTCSGTPDIANFKGTGMAFKTGAGLDWNHGRWGLRILEVDYVHSSIAASGTCSPSCGSSISLNAGANNFELATGVTFNIK